MRTRVRVRPVALLLGALLMASAAGPQAQAGDWLTKGGTGLRTSANQEDLVGLMAVNEAWRAENVGHSATQPVVVGQTIYHLAGAYLWKMQVAENGDRLGNPNALRDAGKKIAEPVNQWEPGQTLISQSTPSYSDITKVLYFGTAYGRLWAYHTDQGWFRPLELEIGCPVVGSPLVLRDQGREFVVVADRPNYPSEKTNPEPGRPLCPRSHGKVWVVSGLGDKTGAVDVQEYQAPTTKSAEGGFGGFITPAAVPGAPMPDGPSFLIGADGFEGGRAIQLVLDRTSNYVPRYNWAVDGSAGFAGNFASDGTNAYWMDTKGKLWGVNLLQKDTPRGWSAYSVNIPALIGAGAAFTNTEPAIVTQPNPQTGQAETHLYLTLRNVTPPGQEGQLRAGRTGSDGAVVALGPGPRLKWYRHFGSAERQGANKASLNTAPLVITSQQVMLFGDVNGQLYSHTLESPTLAGGAPRPFLIAAGAKESASTHSLLADGEEAATGDFNFSQLSGVGVDPAMGAGLVLVGVNYGADRNRDGRLVAYRLGDGYDLRWLGPAPAEPLELIVDQPGWVEGSLELDLTTKRLGQLCMAPYAVQWYLADSSGGLVRQLPETVALPADLAPNQALSVGIDLTLLAADPDEGQVLAVIDHPTVNAQTGEDPVSSGLQRLRQIADQVGLGRAKSCPGPAAEVMQRPDNPHPEGGLLNNILTLPYQKRQLVDDPYVARLVAPDRVEGNRFNVQVMLGYRNNLGVEQAPVQFRLWARPAPDAAAPAGAWQEISLPVCSACTQVDDFFAELSVGTWEVVAEIAYAGDTHPENNRQVRSVVVAGPPQTETQEKGSGLTD